RERRNRPARQEERAKGERAVGHRPGQKSARFAGKRGDHSQEIQQEKHLEKRGHEKPRAHLDEPKAKAELPLPTKVQTVVVTPDEDNMRVDRFLEARFPGLSFSHIQRIVRKGELRVNGKR